MSENNTTPDRPDNPNGGTLAEILFSRGYLDSAGYHLEEAIREMTRGAAEQENKEWLGLQRKRYSIEDGFLKEHELSKQEVYKPGLRFPLWEEYMVESIQFIADQDQILSPLSGGKLFNYFCIRGLSSISAKEKYNMSAFSRKQLQFFRLPSMPPRATCTS